MRMGRTPEWSCAKGGPGTCPTCQEQPSAHSAPSDKRSGPMMPRLISSLPGFLLDAVSPPIGSTKRMPGTTTPPALLQEHHHLPPKKRNVSLRSVFAQCAVAGDA